MKTAFVAVTVVAIAAVLAGCGDRRSRRADAGNTASADAQASNAPASETQGSGAAAFPASCNLTPQQAAGIPALPASGPRNSPDTDFRALTADDERLPGGEYFDVIEIGGRAGQRLRIRLTAEGFQPRAILYDPNGCPWVDAVASPGGAAIVDERLDRTGEYRVLITSSRPGVTGAYDGQAGLSTETPLN